MNPIYYTGSAISHAYSGGGGGGGGPAKDYCDSCLGYEGAKDIHFTTLALSVGMQKAILYTTVIHTKIASR
jgi:hypothetical protein